MHVIPLWRNIYSRIFGVLVIAGVVFMLTAFQYEGFDWLIMIPVVALIGFSAFTLITRPSVYDLVFKPSGQCEERALTTANDLSGGVYEPGMKFLGSGFQRVLRVSVFESGLAFGSSRFGGTIIWPRALPTFIPWSLVERLEESHGFFKGHNIYVHETPGLWRIHIRNLPTSIVSEIQLRIDGQGKDLLRPRR